MKTWKPLPTQVRSFNGKTIQLNTIKNVVYSGKKEVFKLTLVNGLHIKATKDHKFMTKNGWCKLEDLVIDYDEIM